MKRILSVLLWVSLLLTGCYAEEPNGPENPPVEGSIVLEYSDFVVEFYARNYSIGVSAPYAWKAVSNVDWITVDDTIYEGNPDSSVFTGVVYRVESNRADTAREGTITFMCDDYNLSTQLYIYQNAFSADAAVDYLLYAMVAPYSVFGNGNNFGFDFGYPGLMCAMDACTGDVICTAGDENNGYNWFSFWEVGLSFFGPTKTIPMFPWNAYYWFISLCNDIIGTLGADTLSSDSEKSAVGAAKAIRATIYLDMARQYEALEVTDPNLNGSYNISDVRGLTVPIVTENTTVEVAQNNPRATREEMFEFIFQDLDDAEKLLDGIYLANKELPSLAVLYGLKARAYLWLGQFNEGYPNVKTGQAAYQEAAMYARKAISQSNATIMTEKEWLNPITGFNTANNSWMWYLPQSEERIGNLVNYIAWRSVEATWGYGMLVAEGVPSHFYDRISESDWRRKAFVSADPAVWYRENNALTNYMEEDFLTSVPAYANMKFHPADGTTTTYSIGNVTDVPLMRVEEMYLIEAEATAQYDKMAGENLLKAFMANRDPKYTTDGVTDIIDEIIFQKRVELWGEGVVFYDFKRLNMGIQNGYVGTNVPADSRVNTTGRAPWWNFCIPEDEVLHNTALEGKNNPDPDGLVGLWRER